MKIALVQCKQNHVGNYESIVHDVEKASRQGASIICFPELALTGYDLAKTEEDIDEQYDYLHKLKELSMKRNITILVGGIEREGQDRYITQFVINDTIQGYRKIHIGKKEGQYVTEGGSIKVFHSHGLTFGIMICYDTHFPELASIMARMGADVIFAPSASPNHPDKRIKMWKKYMSARAYDNRVAVLGTNLIFGDKGGGMIGYDANGDLLFEQTSIENYMIVIDYVPLQFHQDGMRHRLFSKDRRPEIYRMAEEELVKNEQIY